MTKEEYQEITQAFQPLLQFLAQTHHDEGWHDSRRRYLAHADQRIVALIGKPEDVPEDTAGKKPDTPESEAEIAKVENEIEAAAPHGKNSNPRQTRRGKRRQSPSPYDASLGRLPPKPKNA